MAVAAAACRSLHVQRPRVSRGDVGQLQGARRAGQRQLPLCCRRVGLPARQLRRRGDRLSRLVCADPGGNSAAFAAPANSPAGGGRFRQRPLAGRSRLRKGAGRCQCRLPAARLVARRSLRSLHRRHDGNAARRVVAPGRHLRRRARRPYTGRRDRFTRCGRRTRPGRRLPRHADGAVDARCPLVGLRRPARRQYGGVAGTDTTSRREVDFANGGTRKSPPRADHWRRLCAPSRR